MLAQGRNVDWNNVEAIVEIFAKRLFFKRGAQVAVRGSEESDVDFDGARAAKALELAFLQDAQELHLYGRWHVSNFVEEKRAFIGEFEFSWLAGGGAGERSFFVAEEFALQKIFRDCRAVDFDKRARCAARFFMDGAGD